MKKCQSTLVVFLVFSLFLVSLPQVDMVKAESKTIVVPDDYPNIQEAVNAASDGDTVFVKNGVYMNPFTIDKPLILLAEDNQNTIIEMPTARYPPNQAILVEVDNVTISGFKIINSHAGIRVEHLGFKKR